MSLPLTQREEYLRERCGVDSGLQQRVRRLLDAHEHAESAFLSHPSASAPKPSLQTEASGVYCFKCHDTLLGPSVQTCPNCKTNRPGAGWPSDLLLGQLVAGGQYRVVKRLGAGGFGVVYEAETVVGGLRRALKILREDWAQDASVRERFINEAVVLERINHPNVARCFAAGTLDDDSGLYLLFELIRGTPLNELLGNESENRRLEPLRAVRIARQIASGLVAAHANQILHRDLKPANVIILQPGSPAESTKLLDFGIAKIVSREWTQTAGLLGTPHYMAPEQFSPKAEITQAVDLWQLGATLFAMLTGRPPYESEDRSIQGILALHRPPGVPGPAPSEVVPELSAHPILDRFVSRLLATEPADRPRSAAEICDELALIERSLQPSSSRTRPALLEALCSKPSTHSWVALSRYLETQDKEILNAASQKLSEWPMQKRRAMLSWWQSCRRGSPHPLWRLARGLDLSGQGLRDSDAAELAESDLLASIRSLLLADNLIGPAGVEALAGSEVLSGLEELDLSRNPIGSEGLRLIATSPHLKRLRVLKLARSRIDVSGLRKLVAAGLPIERLDLSQNDLRSAGAEALSQAELPRLRTLLLSDNLLGGDGVALLSTASGWTGLQRLDLSCNSIGPGGAAALALSRSLAQVEELTLAQNNLGREGLQFLLASNSLEALKVLDVSSNSVGANGAMALAGSPLARRLRRLELADNQIGDTGLAGLLGAPHLSGLSSLNLSQNGISPAGISLLEGGGLQLDSLDLSENPIGSSAVDSLSVSVRLLRLRRLRLRRVGWTASQLVALLQNGRGALQELDASYNECGGEGNLAIGSTPEAVGLRVLRLDGALQSQPELTRFLSSPYLAGLEELSLSGNGIGDEGAAAVAEASGLVRLERLSLQDNGIGPEGAAALTQGPLASRLFSLDLSYNRLGDRGAEALAEGNGWHQLVELKIRTNDIGFAGASALRNGSRMDVLQVLDLADNPLTGELDLHSLGSNRVTLIESDFSKISGRGTEFAEKFYGRLFEHYPRVKPLFSHVSMSRQQQHLFSALVMTIENLRSPDTLSESLKALGRRHAGYGVAPAHYEAVAQTLLEVIEEMMGEEWSAVHHEAWKDALEAVSRTMLAAHREVRAPNRG